jgi:hypothetical protein
MDTLGIIDRTKDAITTNNTKPQDPKRPAVRTPAAGPLISTANTKPADRPPVKKGGSKK